MIFIGQDKLLNELNLIVEDIIRGKNHSILLRAPSGYGKTSLAFRCVIVINQPFYYCIPKNGEITNLDLSKRIQVIDEIHILKEPEFLYPLLDSNQYSFILLSNESGSLLEPLKNRCINLFFEKYTDENKRNIINQYSRGKLSKEQVEYILSLVADRPPREIKKLIERLEIIFRNLGETNDLELLKYYVEEILNISPDGLTEQDRIYLEFLKRAERCSLDTLINATRIDRETILREIEPMLLYKGLIKITSRGRQIEHII